MSNGRSVPAKSDEARTLEIRFPAGLTIGDIIELEEALATGVKQMVDWLVSKGAVHLDDIKALPWEEMPVLRDAIRTSVQEYGKVPPQTP